MNPGVSIDVPCLLFRELAINFFLCCGHSVFEELNKISSKRASDLTRLFLLINVYHGALVFRATFCG